MMNVDEELDNNNNNNNNNDIDESLYSRQLYVMGHEAQRKISKSNILIVGLGGVGIEITKNIVLAGVKSVSLLDNTLVTMNDLSSQFYLNESNIGVSRASACYDAIRSLNPYVDIKLVSNELTIDYLKESEYQVIVLTNNLFHQIIPISKYCHQVGIKLVTASVNGLAASIFVDAGINHTIIDKDGEQPVRGLISNITKEENGSIITTHDNKRHGLSTGDYVTFEEVEGMIELNDCTPKQIKVINTYSFAIDNTQNYHNYTGQGYYQQVKQPFNISHDDLETCLNKPNEKIVQDVAGHSYSLHILYQALTDFVVDNKILPNPTNFQHANIVLKYAKKRSKQQKIDINEEFILNLSRCSQAVISPMAAIIGGIAGQEVLKVCTGKFTPFNQLFYYDAYDALPMKEDQDNNNMELNDYNPLNCRYDDQIAIFGRQMQEKLNNLNTFLIGAGAIGCEMLKNWAMMGIATNNKGCINITDMDAIERSNLNRQFLFRANDVGSLKSKVAAREILKMNNKMKIDTKSLRVGVETENIYNDDFWDNLDIVCTALDNIDARLYVDQRCVYYLRPLIDSGTLGTKGNTQVIIPMLTESYGSSRDPPEESIPICTLKNFPYKIEHTIQWSRDWFEGVFNQAPVSVNNYLKNSNFLDELSKQPQTQLSTLQSIVSLLVDEKPLTFNECVEWARHQFDKEFDHNIQQMLYVFPADSVTESGNKFWSGTKREPQPLKFNINDDAHLDFIVAAANLRAYNFGLRGERDREKIANIAIKIKGKEWKPAEMKIAATDEEAKEMEKQKALEEDDEVVINNIVNRLPKPKSLAGYELNQVDFEKDDDNNFHMDFITACSNLRARNYRIKEASKHQTKMIAGKIIPAIATTTALVTGLVCLEIYKILNKKPLEAYRNTYVNLALPLITASEPFEPERQKCILKDRGEWNWSLWDRIEIDIGNCTLKQFIEHFKKQYGLTVTMLSYGASMLFYDFGGPLKKKMKERLNYNMTKLVETVSKQKLNDNERYIVFEACVTNEDDDDVEIPFVRFKFC